MNHSTIMDMSSKTVNQKDDTNRSNKKNRNRNLNIPKTVEENNDGGDWNKEILLYQDSKVDDSPAIVTDSDDDSSVEYEYQYDISDVTYQFNLQIRDCFDDVARAEELLHQAEQMNAADTITYNAVLSVYAKSVDKNKGHHNNNNYNNVGAKAHALLNKMSQIYKTQMERVKQWSAFVATNKNKQIDDDNDDTTNEIKKNRTPRISVKPNVRTYSTIMYVYAKERNAQAAQDLLEEMMNLYEETKDEELRPNVIAYNTVLNACAKCGMAYEAQAILDQMISSSFPEEEEQQQISNDYNNNYNKDGKTFPKSQMVLPDIITYNAVIHAWAKHRHDPNNEKSSQIIPGEQAEKLLRAMPFSPNARSYTTVMDAWSRSTRLSPDAAQRAHDLLVEMERLYPTEGHGQLQPNTISYSTVINAYAQSMSVENKAEKCYQLLQRMEHLFSTRENVLAKPTIVTYNSVLNACAMTSNREEKEQALDIVKSLYEQILEFHEPDNFTYGTVLKACANLSTPPFTSNEEFVESVFRHCCQSGQVTFGVCYQLRLAASTELYLNLLPSEAVNVRNLHFDVSLLPSEWSQNVKNNKRRDGTHSDKFSRKKKR